MDPLTVYLAGIPVAGVTWGLVFYDPTLKYPDVPGYCIAGFLALVWPVTLVTLPVWVGRKVGKFLWRKG